MVHGDMTRLTGLVEKVSEDIAVQVSFSLDKQNIPYFSGNLSTSVVMVCQRCNELFSLDLNIGFNFSPVASEEESENLPEVYDPVVVDEFGEVNLLTLFEDELILALPIVPKHDDEQCSVNSEQLSFGEIAQEEEKPNPFAVLQQLKKN